MCLLSVLNDFLFFVVVFIPLLRVVHNACLFALCRSQILFVASSIVFTVVDGGVSKQNDQLLYGLKWC